MIERPTVFILGAGASKPCGFCAGDGLRDRILDLREGNPVFDELPDQMNHPNWNHQKISEFVAAFRRSKRLSIDSFLENRQDLMDVGKSVIARILLEKEEESYLYRAKTDADWYAYLFEKMKSDRFDEFRRNQVSFLTFNYDRSLEESLSLALANSYDNELEECYDILKSIPIVHLYGSLGSHPCHGAHVNMNWYGNINGWPSRLRASMAEIRIVHEGGRESAFETAKKLLHKAERVFFLGFGYGAENLDRLAIRELGSSPNPHIEGSAYHMSAHEKTAAKRRLGMNSIRFGGESQNCCSFLRDSSFALY